MLFLLFSKSEYSFTLTVTGPYPVQDESTPALTFYFLCYYTLMWYIPQPSFFGHLTVAIKLRPHG
jgi:hypothetical protein